MLLSKFMLPIPMIIVNCLGKDEMEVLRALAKGHLAVLWKPFTISRFLLSTFFPDIYGSSGQADGNRVPEYWPKGLGFNRK